MTVIGTVELIAKIDTSQYTSGAKKIDKVNDDIADSLGGVEKQTKGFSKTGAAAFGVIAGAAAAVANKGIDLITSSVGSAIKRVDTLSNADRVFANMGFSADDAAQTMDNLVESITGLPTTLDSAVSNVQLLAASTGNLDRSQQIFSALNNAVIGFGGTAQDVEGAVVQLSQAFANGRVDAETWNSLIDRGLGPALNALGKQMGKTTGELKSELSDGTISVEQFQDALLTLNKEGGGGMQSFEKIAKDATFGIGTGFTNAQTAISRGIANIIEAIGQENISNAITKIGSAFESALSGVVGFIGFIKDNKEVITTLAVGIGSIVSVLATYQAIVKTVTTAQAILNAVMALNPVVAITLAVIGLVAALVYFFTQTELGRKIWQGFVNFIKSGIEFITSLWRLQINIVKGLFNGLVSFLKTAWNRIRSVFSGVVGFYRGIFSSAVNAVKNVFNGLTGFFRGLWDRIVGIFGSIGTAVGNAIGGAVRGAINSVINGAANIINGFIDTINGVVGTINNIPGVNIGTIGRLDVPQLANGGIVSSPTLAMIGEGRESEAVIPLSKLDSMINGDGNDNVEINQVNNVYTQVDMSLVNKRLVNSIYRLRRA